MINSLESFYIDNQFKCYSVEAMYSEGLSFLKEVYREDFERITDVYRKAIEETEAYYEPLIRGLNRVVDCYQRVASESFCDEEDLTLERQLQSDHAYLSFKRALGLLGGYMKERKEKKECLSRAYDTEVARLYHHHLGNFERLKQNYGIA